MIAQGPEVMNMYEEHAMTAIYMDAEMSHHGDPGTADSTESYHPGLVIEQLNKVISGPTSALCNDNCCLYAAKASLACLTLNMTAF